MYITRRALAIAVGVLLLTGASSSVSSASFSASQMLPVVMTFSVPDRTVLEVLQPKQPAPLVVVNPTPTETKAPAVVAPEPVKTEVPVVATPTPTVTEVAPTVTPDAVVDPPSTDSTEPKVDNGPETP